MKIDHTKTKAYSPQANGICERFHKTIGNEFYAVTFRKKVYRSLEELQVDADAWVYDYNHNRTHTGKHCYGKTPMQITNYQFCTEPSLLNNFGASQNLKSCLAKAFSSNSTPRPGAVGTL
jgi:hypothetical protein